MIVGGEWYRGFFLVLVIWLGLARGKGREGRVEQD